MQSKCRGSRGHTSLEYTNDEGHICGTLIRKFLIHIHRELLRPRSKSLATNLLRTVMLYIEL